jgi:hypothetical protein
MGHRIGRFALPPGGFALALAMLILGAAGSRAAAQDMPVPVETQVPILLKILTFDRAITARPADRLVIGIIFQGRNRISSEIGEQVLRQLKASAPAVRVVPIDLDRTDDLVAALVRDSVQVLYVAPLQAVAIPTLSKATRERQVLSYTGVPRYVEQGLAVGLDVNGLRPQIVINLEASRAEGAVFSAQLLKLVRLTGAKSVRP